jgi:hypothetical protein
MSVYQINPLQDERWEEFLQVNSRSSIFHTRSWLASLAKTYGYEVCAFTTNAPEERLTNALVFCRISSWLTGSRLVSLPFSDHCEPLLDNEQNFQEHMSALSDLVRSGKFKYCELRPMTSLHPESLNQAKLGESSRFCLHLLDLRPAPEDLYRNFHKNHIQRKVQRAEREGLTLLEGRSETELSIFYKLLMLTRRRHQLPPQPMVWFQNLIAGFGEKLSIRIALKGDTPAASILTIAHNKTVVYKYGCSDSELHNLGGMPFLFWGAIQHAKQHGMEEFDFGRSDLDNPGLISFKENFGAPRRDLVYYRYPVEASSEATEKPVMEVARRAFSALPDFCLTAAGRLLYRHIG